MVNFLDRSKLIPVKEEKIKSFREYIDHTLLRADATDSDFDKLTNEALEHNLTSICVAPYIAKDMVSAMRSYPDIKIGTVCAFPQGNLAINVKLKEAHFLLNYGIDELDFVLHYGEILNGNWDKVQLEMQLMGDLCRQAGVTSKCIVETPVLQTDDLLTRVFYTLRDHSCIDYIKSSTGMSYHRTEAREIALWDKLREGNPRPLIKAAGGINTYERALQMIDAGADRLGISNSVKVMEEYYENSSAFTERGEALKEVHAQCDLLVKTGELVL